MSTGSRITLRPLVAPKQSCRAPAAPIVKWAGGKSRLLDHLSALRPRLYRRYFEPFLGGGALFFHLDPRDAVLCDQNADLINMYRCVAWNVEAVIRRLAIHKKRHSEEHYYEVRSWWNERSGQQSDVQRAAAFLYLNKTCYNGLWRVNSKGLFNVPMGRYDDPQIFDPDRLRAASPLLRRAQLVAGQYTDGAEPAASGDFVYFDPPYHPLTPSANFTSYTPECFSEDDQRELALVARRLTDRGCAVMISNSDTPFVRSLYRGFRVHEIAVARAINSKGSARGAVGEVIVTNHYVTYGGGAPG